MRITPFGEPVFQAGDDFFAEWTVHFDEEPQGEIARFIEEDDGKWGCEIADNNDHTAQANDFPSEADLRAWLTKNQITIEA
jgi:hypothetical protein